MTQPLSSASAETTLQNWQLETANDESLSSLEIHSDRHRAHYWARLYAAELYGESPAVQVTSGKATVKVTEQTLSQVETALANANLKPTASSLNKAHSKIPSACVLIRLRLKSSFVRAK